ncbi:nucleotidyltransferase domain-containing protein [Nonomuraea typhae]|uniref:nucleotidyltransferase domain-containing protein n=1 Tax=Nonomuraea typhae TaxID=2603600 RepID=UPI0015E1C41A|nr:nucleotidyltransferase domain-containing protein [Nonomuraea typhae]
MIKNAVEEHSPFSGISISIYAKGSYANNTNVKRDSDVDVVVECNECFYYDFAPEMTSADVGYAKQYVRPYEGPWHSDLWRKEVVAALTNKFGDSGVDTSGNIAINIAEVVGSRPNADVVPSYPHRRFKDAALTTWALGSHVVGRDSSDVVNWPNQQLENGRAKNTRTGGRYKNMVRALKNVENVLAEADLLDDLPSYLMECLVYNVADDSLKNGSLDDAFQQVLLDLAVPLVAADGANDWVEPNEIKKLFGDHQKWAARDAHDLIFASLRFMGYIS